MRPSHAAKIRSILLAFLLVPFITAISCAERIVPSDRVRSNLNVREFPQVGSAVVGVLYPQQSAEFLESVPYWYQVRLDDGTSGYVSKTWAELVAQAQESGGLVRIGSWNIKKLGHGSQKDYATVAKIIESNFDVMAVIEVMQKGGTCPGYEPLLSALGPAWKGLVTDDPRPNTTSGNAEYYAILYRSALVRTCPGWDKLAFHPDNDGNGQGSGVDVFAREPAFGCFEVPNSNSTVSFDFLLAGYHARWENGNKEMIMAEVGNLKDVFQAMGDSRPGETDLIIAGDFNLIPSEILEVLHFVPETVASGSTLNSSGAITQNVYDHILVHNKVATQEMIDHPTIIDVTPFSHDGHEFYTRVSDHLPIMARFRTFGPDDD